MSSNQQYKDYNKRLKSQLCKSHELIKQYNKELIKCKFELFECNNQKKYIEPKSNLHEYICFFIGLIVGAVIMYLLK